MPVNHRTSNTEPPASSLQPPATSGSVSTHSQRGGRRPGAGAPRGNLNGLKNGRYSAQVQALNGALEAMPMTARLMAAMIGADQRNTKRMALAMRYLAEMTLLRLNRDAIRKKAGSINKRGVSINRNERAQMREILKFAKSIKGRRP